jgi:Protein of unknown function (DUF1236)
MRNQRTTFLAGIAALALIAGTGFAAAQDSAKDQKGAMQPKASTPSTKTEKGGAGKMGQSAQPGKMGETQGGANAQPQGTQKGKVGENESSSKAEGKTGKSSERMDQSAKGAKSSNRHAQEMKRGEGRRESAGENKGNTERFGESKTGNESKADRERMNDEGRAAEGERTKQGAPTTAEQSRQGGPNTAESRGAKGGAGGVALNDEQRTRIRDTVINAHGAPRVGSVNFGVNVGTVIPRGSIQIVPVPETLVRIEPRWRGFRYFIFEDELVIVDPHDMTIVAVVPV